MSPSPLQLRDDALQIWRAGLEAVRSDRLIRQTVRVEEHWLLIGDEEPIDLDRVGRLAVVGAGKAGAGMAGALEAALGPECCAAKQLAGWVNVPADCVQRLQYIRLHAARPAGRNEPTAEGVAGAEEILRIVGGLEPEDICIALISGGGSALLPAPVAGVTLADKLALTRHLSAAGADIRQLNTVRKQLSRIKGGGLARACRAGKLISLVVSDVPGDALDVIASGPTVEDHSTPEEALAVLKQFDSDSHAIPASVYADLSRQVAARAQPASLPLPLDFGELSRTGEGRDVGKRERPLPGFPHPNPLPKGEGTDHTAASSFRTESSYRTAAGCLVTNLIIGNNATAVDAAGAEAERLGYSHAMVSATKPEGPVEEIGRHLADMAVAMRDAPGPDCLISGGEGTVRLVDEHERGMGGRNQQLALAALIRLAEHDPRGIALVSAGTDGEDGPTDAAGAVVDESMIAEARRMNLDAADFLRRNDSYHFFQPLGALLQTGPTHTNVCDLRVLTVDQRGK